MALVSCLVVVGAAVLLSAVCCLLFAVSCLLAVVSCLLSAVCCLLLVVCCLLSTFVICSLFVRCLFTLCTLSFRSLFVLCSLYVCCRQLFASCMHAAVGRKIKYRFHALPLRKFFLIAFMWHLCDVRPPSVFLPSAIRKVPGETAFLHHLLEFVIGRPAPGVSLASPAREPHPEGAGESAVCPSPS